MDAPPLPRLMALTTLVLLSGCATTTMKTAERLGSGEVVAGGGFDVLPTPTRVHGHLQLGAGDVADVGFHGGLGLPTHIGASTRLYLGPRVDFSSQADFFLLAFDGIGCTLILIIPICEPDFADLFTLSARLTTAMRELEQPGQSGVYGGLTAYASTGDLGRARRGSLTNPFEGGAVGLVGGFERRQFNGVNFQTEITLIPYCFGASSCRAGVQLSFGWNYGAHRPGIQRQPEPQDWARDPSRDRRRPERWPMAN
jgi:hypothetical protein